MSLHTHSKDNTLELVSLSKHYSADSIAVDSINLKVPTNHYCCLLGPSGCGKTSTLRMVAGHEVVTSGDVILGGRNITQAQAFDHIAGYACFNDGTARDWQRHTHQWIPGKNFPLTGPLGPFMATSKDIPDVKKLTLESRLNGEVMQHASVADLIYTLPVIIEYLSGFTNLSPGDVIATGTPGGVGDRREPPVYMKAGDVIEVEITGLGTLRNVVSNAA